MSGHGVASLQLHAPQLTGRPSHCTLREVCQGSAGLPGSVRTAHSAAPPLCLLPELWRCLRSVGSPRRDTPAPNWRLACGLPAQRPEAQPSLVPSSGSRILQGSAASTPSGQFPPRSSPHFEGRQGKPLFSTHTSYSVCPYLRQFYLRSSGDFILKTHSADQNVYFIVS